MEIFTKSAQDTQKLGQKIATNLIKGNPPSSFGLRRGKGGNAAFVLALSGELGSGKTTFTQGFVGVFGLPDRIVSPTFILVREYPLKAGRFRRLYHIDLYRLDDPKNDDLGLNEIFRDPSAIVVIEWAERLGEQLPLSRMEIHFEHVSGEERKITVSEL